MCSCSRSSDIIIRLTIGQNDEEVLVRSIFHWPKHIPGGEGDGIAGGGAPAHVVDAADGRQDLVLADKVGEAELGSLVVGELHGRHLGADVGDLKSFGHVAHELQHEAEVALSDAAGTVYQETDVDGVVAGLATQHLLV